MGLFRGYFEAFWAYLGVYLVVHALAIWAIFNVFLKDYFFIIKLLRPIFQIILGPFLKTFLGYKSPISMPCFP